MQERQQDRRRYFDEPGSRGRIKAFLKPKGTIFIAFPAWQMPSGGHRQMCRNRCRTDFLFPICHLPHGTASLPKKVAKVHNPEPCHRRDPATA